MAKGTGTDGCRLAALPETVRAQIVAMVKASGKGRT